MILTVFAMSKRVCPRFTIGRFVGKGATSRCYECTIEHIPEPQYLAKHFVIELTTRNINNMVREVKILKSLRHPNIVRYIGFVKQDDKHYLVTELCDCNLREYTTSNRLSTNDIQCIMRQVANAIMHLHERGIVHRDIKLENVFVVGVKDSSSSRTDSVKIGDFGLATGTSPFKGRCGTTYFMAPELSSGGCYGFEVDVWSMGVLMYRLLEGKMPYLGENSVDIEIKAKGGHVLFTSQTPEEAKGLISAMLTIDPTKRPSAKEVATHPFILCNVDHVLPTINVAPIDDMTNTISPSISTLSLSSSSTTESVN